MPKLYLTILLAAASTCAVAGWLKVGNNGGDTFYTDPGTIIKTGNKIKMRSLHDYQAAAKAAGNAFLSSETQDEYDCKEKQARTLYFSFHSKNMGKGRKVYSDSAPHDWETVRLGSAREALWDFACKRK